MELLQTRIGGDIASIGLMAIGGLAILTNRFARNFIIHSQTYDRVSLQAEHIVFHYIMALGLAGGTDALMVLMGSQSPNSLVPFYAAGGSLLQGLDYDGLRPARPQIGQMISDTVGSLIYLLPYLSLK